MSPAEFLAVLAEQVSTSPDTGQGRFRQDRLAAGMLATAWRHMVFGQA